MHGVTFVWAYGVTLIPGTRVADPYSFYQLFGFIFWCSFLMAKNKNKKIFLSTGNIFIPKDLLEGLQSYTGSLQPSKENIRHFIIKKLNFYHLQVVFILYCRYFLPPGIHHSPNWIRMRHCSLYTDAERIRLPTGFSNNVVSGFRSSEFHTCVHIIFNILKFIKKVRTRYGNVL